MDTSHLDRLARDLASRTSRRTVLGTALAALALGGIDRVDAGQATPSPAATSQAGEEPVLLYVQTAASGRGEVNPAAGTPAVDGTPTPAGGASFLLTLEGHPGLTVSFSDRPDRIAGAMPTGSFFDTLGFTPGNPPNAALIGEFKAGQGVVVLQLTDPTWDPDTGALTYGAEFLDAYRGGNLEPVTREQVAERLPAVFGPAALFIDSGAMVILEVTTVAGASLNIVYSSYPPTQLDVCGFSGIPGAIGSHDEGTAAIARLYRGATPVGVNEFVTADCVTIYPQPGGSSFPSGSYRLEVAQPSDWSVLDVAYFTL
jgi:hypothetical protein